MAVTKQKKAQQVEKLTKDLTNVSNVVVATYTKMTRDYEPRWRARRGAKQQVVATPASAAKGTICWY